MIEDWSNKKNLAKLGFQFDSAALTDFEVSCYSIIENKFKELEVKRMEQDLKKGSK